MHPFPLSRTLILTSILSLPTLAHAQECGNFATQACNIVGDDPLSVALGDLDGDGDLDVAVANQVSDDTSVLLNNGDGSFATETRYAAGDEPQCVSLGDLDGDGDLDMVVANSASDNLCVLLNQFQPPVPCPADMNQDEALNFIDISAFLVAFASQDCAADFASDSNFNFLDVSAFLQAFGAGCP